MERINKADIRSQWQGDYPGFEDDGSPEAHREPCLQASGTDRLRRTGEPANAWLESELCPKRITPHGNQRWPIYSNVSWTNHVCRKNAFERKPPESRLNPLMASTVSSRGRFGMRNMARMSAKTSFAACCCLFRQFPPFSGNFRLCSGNFRLCFGSGCFCVHVQFHEPLANCVSGIKSAADALNPHAIR